MAQTSRGHHSLEQTKLHSLFINAVKILCSKIITIISISLHHLNRVGCFYELDRKTKIIQRIFDRTLISYGRVCFRRLVDFS